MLSKDILLFQANFDKWKDYRDKKYNFVVAEKYKAEINELFPDKARTSL